MTVAFADDAEAAPDTAKVLNFEDADTVFAVPVSDMGVRTWSDDGDGPCNGWGCFLPINGVNVCAILPLLLVVDWWWCELLFSWRSTASVMDDS